LQLENARIVLASIGLIIIVLFALPTISLIIKPLNSQSFSELYILGPNHNFDNVPFNIKTGQTYSVYLGVVNNLGSSAYYTCLVKIANENELPKTTPPTLSSSAALYEFKPFLTDKESWETPLTFRLDNLTPTNNAYHLSDVTINSIHYTVDKTFPINADKKAYYASLIVELWLFNSTTNSLEYNNRFVSLNLNLTQ
jgi:uncharacterized membrane protein